MGELKAYESKIISEEGRKSSAVIAADENAKPTLQAAGSKNITQKLGGW